MKIITKTNAPIFLLLNALFWGSSYIWSKMLLDFLPPFFILFSSSILGLLVTAVIFRSQINGFTKKILFIGVSISLISTLSNMFCMLALKRTSGTNTAFIVQLSIVITPVIMGILEKKVPSSKVLLPALTATFGVFLITCSGKGFNINPGDIFALCNAICFSLYLALQNKFSKLIHPIQFTFIQHATNSLVFLALSLIMETGAITFENAINKKFFILFALNALVVIFTALFQSSAIKYVRPENATVIYAFEPLTTALLGALVLGELFTGVRTIAGCALILLAAVISTISFKRTGSEPLSAKRQSIYKSGINSFFPIKKCQGSVSLEKTN